MDMILKLQEESHIVWVITTVDRLNR